MFAITCWPSSAMVLYIITPLLIPKLKHWLVCTLEACMMLAEVRVYEHWRPPIKASSILYKIFVKKVFCGCQRNEKLETNDNLFSNYILYGKRDANLRMPKQMFIYTVGQHIETLMVALFNGFISRQNNKKQRHKPTQELIHYIQYYFNRFLRYHPSGSSPPKASNNIMAHRSYEANTNRVGILV